MKFLGAASTGAITSLLLLVPAALGTQVYTCYRSQPLSKALIDDLARYATADQVYENDPGYGDRQVHKTHRFSKNKDATGSVDYLIQIVGPQNTIMVFEYSSHSWLECPLS
ncbi:Bgt-51729 [Blumeria graminis f. sp. tritici]|uniref:Bgt-51729 n=1 Tax=Blumeria graminis f. sp. tritici TaxID=62690 RepID=A0A9X9PQA0_BLUGR|nr:AvrPm17 [Blumeria graminis f. sp. tritici]VCU38995.1 Bgt-51729 [Blumeria graminis f. sp. tritici]